MLSAADTFDEDLALAEECLNGEDRFCKGLE